MMLRGGTDEFNVVFDEVGGYALSWEFCFRQITIVNKSFKCRGDIDRALKTST